MSTEIPPPSVTPEKKKTSTGKKVLYCVVGFFVLAGIGKACSGDKQQGGTSVERSTATAAAPAIQISADELVAAYKANEVAADNKYKGKELIVGGHIDNIGKDLLDNRYVAFKAAGEFEIREVQCFFEDEHDKELASLASGGFVKIRGECKGMMGMIHLDDCVLVR